MKRVLILGCPGAGKSVLARKMAAILSLPVIHLDRHYWNPGWIETDKDAWLDKVTNLVRQPAWIMDGNYSRTLPLRLPAADTVIDLDFPTALCLVRAIRRAAMWFGRTRGDDIAPDCPERLDWDFVKYILRFRRDQRPRVLMATASFTGRLIVLKKPAEVDAFLRQLRAE